MNVSAGAKVMWIERVDSSDDTSEQRFIYAIKNTLTEQLVTPIKYNAIVQPTSVNPTKLNQIKTVHEIKN